jgi:hypothetical protein
MKKNVLFAGILALVLGLSMMSCKTIESVDRGGPNAEQRFFNQRISVPNKDFESLGMVFTEVFFEIDARGSRGDVFTYNALLKEAHKLGADAIINVVIDVKKEGSTNYLFNRNLGIAVGKETWFGSATAIKYTETLVSKETITVDEDGNEVARTTEKTGLSNGSLGGVAIAGELTTTTKKVWYNPFSWFKK